LVGAHGFSLPSFLALSLADRLLRFGALATLTAWLTHGPLRALSYRRKLLILNAVRITVYVIYFSILGF